MRRIENIETLKLQTHYQKYGKLASTAVKLSKNNIGKYIPVRQFIMRCFNVPTPLKKSMIDHKDRNPANNIYQTCDGIQTLKINIKKKK